MAATPATGARIFVSYARSDSSELASELVTALDLLGFDGMLDREDIAAAEDWERRLDTLIRQCDTVVFVLSPRSVQSQRCAWEVARATELSKRIVPVLGLPVDEARVPPALQRLNFIDFSPGHSFARAMGRLADALRLDIAWIREHTRVGELAQRWRERDRPEALLLRGDELLLAQDWMAQWQTGAPAVTEVQREFVAASVQAQAQRASIERRQNEAMARANEERSQALARQEQALLALRRRTLQGAALALLFSAGIAGMGWWSLRLRRRAEEAEKRSIAELVKAESQRRDISGQIVAYAALPGQPAADAGPEGVSPYTAALLQELRVEQASLWTAVSRASTRVFRDTRGLQRPFISSDMNGDLYLRLRSPTRRLHALVLGVGRMSALGDLDLPGVYRDIEAWRKFLLECGFEVTLLKDPRKQAVDDALRGVRLALGRAPTGVRRIALKLEPGLPAASVAAPQAREPAKPAEPAKPEPAKDSLVVVFYSGYGFRVGADRYLAVADTGLDAAHQPDAKTAVPVAGLETSLRESVAASLLILDTNFI
jgi:hypothetical protein